MAEKEVTFKKSDVVFNKTVEDWYDLACEMYSDYHEDSYGERSDYPASYDDFYADFVSMYEDTVKEKGNADDFYSRFEDFIWESVN